MAEKELSPIRIPVLLDTRGLENQIRGTNAKIQNGFRGGGVGGAGGVGGIGGGGVFQGSGFGGGGVFAAGAAGAGFATMSNVISTQFMMAQRQQATGMRIKKTKRTTGSQYSHIQPVGNWRIQTPGLGMGKTFGIGFPGYGMGTEETSEYTFFNMSNEQAAAFQQTAAGGGGAANPYSGSRGGRRSQRALTGSSRPKPPPDARYMDQVTNLERLGGSIGGRLGGAIGALGTLSKSPIAGIGLAMPITMVANKLAAGYDYFRNYGSNMRNNTQGLVSQYTDPALMQNALNFQTKWNSATVPTKDKFQRWVANMPGWVGTAVDFMSTGLEVTFSPEILTPNAVEFHEQKKREFMIRNFGTQAQQKELIRQQKRAAAAAARNAV